MSSAQEARVVTETIINSTQAREEISTFFDSFGGLAQLRSNPRLWDLYLKAYDRVPTNPRVSGSRFLFSMSTFQKWFDRRLWRRNGSRIVKAIRKA